MKPAALLAVLLLTLFPMLVRADTDSVNGVWHINGKVEGFAVNVSCALERHGDDLSGVCHDGGVDGPSHVLSSGAVHGDKVTWTYKRRFLVSMFEPRYSGQIDGDSMRGDINVAGHSGVFTADRE